MTIVSNNALQELDAEIKKRDSLRSNLRSKEEAEKTVTEQLKELQSQSRENAQFRGELQKVVQRLYPSTILKFPLQQIRDYYLVAF